MLSFKGWILLFFSSSAVYERYAPTVSFFLGRLLTGFGCGLTSATNLIYIYEIAPTSLKVVVGSLFQIGITCGIVVVYAFAIYLNWDVISLICGLLVLCTTVLTFMLPESPKWCIKTGNLESAEASHSWLYGNQPDMPTSILNEAYLAICSVTFSLSWGPLPFLYIIELFPSVNRNYAIVLSLAVNWIVGFFVTFLFEPFVSWINVSSLFCIFSSFCLLACFYVYRYVPEIKSMNLI
ncbi:unnamed protein product [Trichobilharzia regenti]|nr:unnamed protein product [Trichobilharzia regenti]